MTDRQRWYSPRLWGAPLFIALLTFVAVAVAIDPGGDLPDWPGGPGVTLDEGYNVEQGTYLVRQFRSYGWGAFAPESLREIYSGPSYNPDHPPLGRLWLGIAHECLAPDVFDEHDPMPWRIVYARVGSASAFACTVLLVGWFAATWYGRATGVCAALGLVLMPRVFGHAHLASLETVMGFFYAVAALAVAALWTRETPPTGKAALVCGILWGLAMLTKIQGLLLCVPVGLWALAYWRTRSILPLAVWGLTGAATFCLFWPWLWSDPVSHVQKYLGRTTERSPLKVYYLGEVYTDRKVPELPQYDEVPWHYPLLMFLVTVPLGLHVLAGMGMNRRTAGRRFDPRTQVVLATLAFPVLLFCVPGVAVYDGARLFLVAFPLWAILVGRGGAAAWDWLGGRKLFARVVAVVALVGTQLGSMFALHPCYLSDYSFAVGGLPGAVALGFEPTYWGDSIDRKFQTEIAGALPRGTRLGIAPVLDHAQIPVLRSQSRILQAHGIALEPYDPARSLNPQFDAPPEYVLTFARLADRSSELADIFERAELVVEHRRMGVQLAAVYRRR